MFMTALFLIAKNEKQPRCPSWTNGETDYGISIPQITTE